MVVRKELGEENTPQVPEGCCVAVLLSVDLRGGGPFGTAPVGARLGGDCTVRVHAHGGVVLGWAQRVRPLLRRAREMGNQTRGVEARQEVPVSSLDEAGRSKMQLALLAHATLLRFVHRVTCESS